MESKDEWGCQLDLNIDDIDAKVFKQRHKFAPIPPDEGQRLGILHDLHSIRTQYLYFEDDQFTTDDLNIMINDICIS